MKGCLASFVSGCVVFAALPAAGAINLEWRPAQQTVRPGDTVDIGLYAVSDNAGNQPISAMDVLLEWDASTLQLVGVVNNGPYAWFQSGFFSDSSLDGINNTFADGDAKYTALAQFVTPASATPAGLLVTTVRFQALAGTPGNIVSIPLTLGPSSETAVYGTAFPGQDVTGTRGSAEIVVCFAPADGDLNEDGSPDGLDIQDFVQAVLDTSTASVDVCHADFDDDGMIDLGDLDGFIDAVLN